MREFGKELLLLTLSILLVLSFGTAGYSIIEKWSFFDSLYMTVITLATVGYGETHELSSAGRVFTIFLIMGGIGIMTYIFTTITSIVMEGDLKNFFRRIKMENRIASLKNHFIICGETHTGLSIAEELHKTCRDFVIISLKKEDIAKMVAREFNAIEGDATSDEVLETAGIRNAAGIFCTLNNDKDNAFIALTARGINPSLKIISVLNENTDSIRNKLLRSGADIVISPFFIGGLRMVSEMVRPGVVSFLDSMLRENSKKGFRFEEIPAEGKKSLEGKTIKDFKTLAGRSVMVVAVKGKDGYEINPDERTLIKQDDTVIMLGNSREISALSEKLS